MGRGTRIVSRDQALFKGIRRFVQEATSLSLEEAGAAAGHLVVADAKFDVTWSVAPHTQTA